MAIGVSVGLGAIGLAIGLDIGSYGYRAEDYRVGYKEPWL